MGKVWRAAVALAVVSVIAIGCTTSAPPPTSPTPEVASTPASPGVGAALERTFFVAPTGDDSAPGSGARPLRTLQAAQLAVRTLLAQEPRTNARVSIASGTYPLASTLVFDGRDSPADGFTVRYTGPADASAVLSGARPLAGWEVDSNGIHRAPLPAGASSVTLYESGLRATLARTPNEGYLRVAAAVGEAGSATEFVHGAGDLPDGTAPTSMKVYLWSGCSAAQKVNYDWETDVLPVRSIDRATRTVTLTEAAAYPICAGNRYILQGARAFLDRPGEFAVEDGFVHYRPRSGALDAEQVAVSTLARLVEVKGTSATAAARNITFERLTFAHAAEPGIAKAGTPGRDHAAIYLENAENIVIRASRIRDIGGSGVLMRLHAQRIVVEGSVIERVGVHGVWISGPLAGAPRASRENRVANTRIRSGGGVHGSGSGVKVEQSAANEIANNEISEMPRYGISLKGSTVPLLQRFQPQLGATAQNLNDLRHTRDNVVRRNDVSRVMTDSQDGGGIEMWGAGPGNRVEENRVHDIDTGDRREGFTSTTAARGPLLHGIYLDDASDATVVRGNVVYGIRGPNASPIMIKGIGSEVSGNVFVNDGGGAGMESSQDASVPVSGLRITRNLVVRSSGSDAYWFRSYTESTLAEADRNLFFSAAPLTVRFRFAGELVTLEQWRARYGFDKASLTADPLFVDATGGDYRVRPGSPALALGFVNVDPTVVGLRPDFAFGR